MVERNIMEIFCGRHFFWDEGWLGFGLSLHLGVEVCVWGGGCFSVNMESLMDSLGERWSSY